MKKLTLLIALPLLCHLGCAKKPLLSTAKDGDQAFQECHRLGQKKDYERSNECFELLKSRFSGSAASFEADLEIGDNYFRKGDYLLAADTYLAFAKLHPTHERIGYAFYRIGLSYLRESPKPIDRNQQYLDSAIHYLELAINNNTGDLREVSREKWREARLRIARRHFYIGRFYYRTGEYRSAIPRFQDVVANYSGLGLDERALFLLGDSYVRLAEKERAAEILSVFDQHFPKSPLRKKLAKKMPKG